MVSCKHCATPNSLDSTFCKRCGTTLPEADIKLAQEKLDALVMEGMSAFNEGRTEEAMAVAESAVLSNPSSVMALSLMADCHARRGEIAQALDCAERIVELNPDSELDKIKRNQLRNQLATNLRVPEAPDRRLAVTAAVAAAVLVVSIGAIGARMTTKPEAPVQQVAQLEPRANILDTPQTQPANPSPQEPAAAQPEAQGQPAPNQTSTQAPQSGANLQPDDVPPVRAQQTPPASQPRLPRAPLTGSLPNASEGVDSTPQIEVAPLNPMNGRIGILNQAPKTLPPATTPPPVRRDPDPVAETKPAEPKDEGQYDIRVRSGSPRTTTGGSARVEGNGLEALVRTGTQQYQVGNYSGAAASFERALRSGGDAISLNQRLALSYEKLGRTGEAASAYGRAIEAAESALNSGRGNKDRIQSVLESCRQALKVLQGG